MPKPEESPPEGLKRHRLIGLVCGPVVAVAMMASPAPDGLSAVGCRVLVPRALSPNDGAISFGQAAVAATLLRMT